MSDQINRLGYQPSNAEIAQEEQEQNLLLNLLGGGALTAGAGAGLTGIRAEKRRRDKGGSYSDNFKATVSDMRSDIQAAGQVVRGKTQFDADEKDQGSNRRSMRSYAESGIDPRFNLDTSKGYISNPITQAAIAARDAFNPSSEDFLSVDRSMRRERGESPEGPRSQVALSRIPFIDGARDILPAHFFGFKDEVKEDRQKRGVGLMKGNNSQAAGGMLGRLGADFVNNGVRSAWWLINAPQAVSDLASEEVAARFNREGLYGVDYALESEAKRRGWINSENEPLNSHISNTQFQSDKPDASPFLRNEQKKLMAQGQSGPMYSRRRVGNNLSTLLALPSAIAINSGLGLNNPFGGDDGRKAVFASEEDASKTNNVLAEVAAKYILGRQGDLLPWDEFKKVRPDVTKNEFMAYKGYRFNKNPDYNIFDDGDINMLNGVLKRNDDGINGAEWMFLGKSMSDATTLLPTGAAVLGAGLGVGLAKHGALNIVGQEGAIERKEIERQVHAEKIDAYTDLAARENRVLTDAEQKLDERAGRRGQQLTDGIESRQNLLKFMNENKYASPVFRGLKNRGAIGMGLAGGFTALAGGSVIGNEIERRRREGKVQERQERGY